MLKSNMPTAKIMQLPPRGKKRKPRVLSYSKCRFCRNPKVKSKCIWNQGSWPNKCRRCSEKNLTCSQPLHKAEELRASPEAQPPTSLGLNSRQDQLLVVPLDISGISAIPSEQSAEMGDFLVLQLLALRSLVLMASDECVTICETLLQPMKHDPVWEHHADILYRACSEHEEFAWSLQKRIHHLEPHSKLAMSAALDLEHFSRAPRPLLASSEEARTTYHPYTDRVINDYHRKGHPGIVTVLLMQKFLRFGMVDIQVPVFLQCRRDFITSVFTLMRSNFVMEVSSKSSLALYEDSQLFIPGTLLRHALIRQDYEEIGLNDCLGRSVALRKYDAGITELEASFKRDPHDCIGRTLLHAACVRDDEETVDALITKGLVCATKTNSGLSPLHIAAIAGQHCFRKLYIYYARLEEFSFLLSRTDRHGRTFFEWAASCGKSHAIEFHLSGRKLGRHRSGYLDSIGTIWLSIGSAATAFELAIRYSHTDTLRTLLMYLEHKAVRDDQGRTPLWFAAHYKCLDTLHRLTVNNDNDIIAQDIHGISPLMEASRVGFYQGLDYFIRLLSGRVGFWMVDNNGKTARVLAGENGHPHCVQLILDYCSPLPLPSVVSRL